MRLSQQQVERIRSTVSDMMPSDSHYQLGLFGSRLNDESRGGDVDIYLEVTGLGKQEQQRIKRRLRPRLEEMLDLPVDLVMQDSAEPLTLVSKIAREKGQRL